MVATAVAIDDRPSAFRYPRGEGMGVALPERGEILAIGRGRVLREGSNMAILSLGTRLADAMKAADELAARGLSTTVADARFAKPLDTALIERLAREHEVLITIEEGSIGGCSAAVMQHLAWTGLLDRGLKVRPMVMPDIFIDHDSQAKQLAEAGCRRRTSSRRLWRRSGWVPRCRAGGRSPRAEAKKQTPPPLEGGGWGRGPTRHEPLPPTPCLKGKGSMLPRCPAYDFATDRLVIRRRQTSDNPRASMRGAGGARAHAEVSDRTGRCGSRIPGRDGGCGLRRAIHQILEHDEVPALRSRRFGTALIQSGRESVADLSIDYYNRGNAYNRTGRHDAAIADYTKAIALNPDFAAAYGNRGSAYGRAGRNDDAIADYTRAIVLRPDVATTYHDRGLGYARKGAYDEAIADYTRAIALKHDFANAYDSRGSAYDAKHLYDKAIADYTQAITLRPDYPAAYYNRGRAYIGKGLFDETIADDTKAITLKADFAGAYDNRGLAYDRKGLDDLAIGDFTKGIAIDPGFAAAYLHRGFVYGRKNLNDQAIADLTKAIGLKPDVAAAYNYRGYAYDKKGLDEEALADYDRSAALNQTMPCLLPPWYLLWSKGPL